MSKIPFDLEKFKAGMIAVDRVDGEYIFVRKIWDHILIRTLNSKYSCTDTRWLDGMVSKTPTDECSLDLLFLIDPETEYEYKDKIYWTAVYVSSCNTNEFEAGLLYEEEHLAQEANKNSIRRFQVVPITLRIKKK